MPAFARQDTSGFDDRAYQDYILQGVSRTFALTIPHLPAALREAVSNAYLLCRIADTIEDDAGMSADDKRAFSEQFIQIIGDEEDPEKFAGELLPALSPSATEAERDLIENIPRVIRITRGLSRPRRAAIARCVAIMAEGMAYYQAKTPHAGLDDLNRLNSYCYHVAGVVGEMLTELFCDYCPAMDEKRDDLMPTAVSFGQGLQMTNILKDFWEDYRRGVCWLPRAVFSRHGAGLDDVDHARRDPAFVDGLNELIGITHAHLRNALQYTLLIPRREKGMRRFCLLALGMAVLTLRRIHGNPLFTASSEVKISRRAVFAVVTLSKWTGGSDALVRALFNLAAAGLPTPIHSPICVDDIRIDGYLNAK